MAEKIGMTHTTLSRQLMDDKTPGSTVAELCRAYGIRFDEACVAAGWLTAEESAVFARHAFLEELSDMDLSKEMLRRVAAGTATTAITEPSPQSVIDDVLREVEDAREQGRQSQYAAAAHDDDDNTPGSHIDDHREGL